MRIDADFTEDTVSIVLATYLTLLSFPLQRFSIVPFSRSRERSFGADARLWSRVRGLLPFYMQFKRPSAYPEASKSKIIKDRRTVVPPLSSSPRALYFGLREKKATHFDYQHNILFRLNRRLQRWNLGDAVYVCPLFLDRQAYMFHSHIAGLKRLFAFWSPGAYVTKEVIIVHGADTTDFKDIPFFSEHITIPPHAAVTSAKHNYSFNESGREICFHSPLSIREGSTLLDSWLNGLLRQFLGGNVLVRPESASDQLRSLLSADDNDIGFNFAPDFDPDQPFSAWLSWGDFLYTTYQIEQYAFLAFEA